MAAKYKIRSEVIPYPGMAAWFFAHVDKKQSEIIRTKHHVKKRGFGSIKVKATIGKTTWSTSIFPDKRSGTYVLPLKSSVRKAEGIARGDRINLTLTI